MSLSPSELRRRVAASITTQIGPDGWHESAYTLDNFPGVNVNHLDFAVGLGRSRGMPDRQRRTGPSRGVLCETPVVVRFTAQIRADGQVADLDEALDFEVTLADAALATDRDPELGIRFVEVSLRAQPLPGWFLGELQFVGTHRYPLGR